MHDNKNIRNIIEAAIAPYIQHIKQENQLRFTKLEEALVAANIAIPGAESPLVSIQRDIKKLQDKLDKIIVDPNGTDLSSIRIKLDRLQLAIDSINGKIAALEG